MRTSNAVCFIFYPHSTACSEPKRIGKRIVASKWSKSKSCSCNTLHCSIGFANYCNSRTFRHSYCGSKRIPGQILSKRDVWVFITRAAKWRNWLFYLQHMMRVMLVRVWATPRQRCANCNSLSAYSTLPPNLRLSECGHCSLLRSCDACVEFGNHCVPCRNVATQVAPERL